MMRPLDERRSKEVRAMPPTKATAKKKTAPKAAPKKKPAAKKVPASRAATTPPPAKRAHAKRIKERLHTPIGKRPKAVSETELEAVTAAVLLVVADVATETAEVFAELIARIDRVEARLGR
jgi:hypothetical protein